MACSFQGSLPHIATMGRDEILQQTPLKTPLDRAKYAWQSFTPHYDRSINKAYLYWIENRAI
ncbi:hypothetical protein E5E53_06685 [Helicobacter pylori]|nr:hypothetical protein [Helicobacter pylori]WRF39732.1 hypothetical protein E5E53_06685 [Helicobacter pylori]